MVWPLSLISRHRNDLHHIANDADNNNLHEAPRTANDHHLLGHLEPPPTQLSWPVYIYPGLKKSFRDHAVILDRQCPASIYCCKVCQEKENQAKNREQSVPVSDDVSTCETKMTISEPTDDSSHSPPAVLRNTPTPKSVCDHPEELCAICLESFHSKDLVRTLPCSINGCLSTFHSRCILSWLTSHRKYRCPLCNAQLSQNTPTLIQTPSKHRMDTIQLHDEEDERGALRCSTHCWNPDGVEDFSHVGDIVHWDERLSLPLLQRSKSLQLRCKCYNLAWDRHSNLLIDRHSSMQSYSYIVHDDVRFDVKS